MAISALEPRQKEATIWKLDPAHTQVSFQVAHMMFSKVRGRFAEVEATIYLAEEEDVLSSRVDAVIDAASIDTGNAQRDEHLRSADFFDVERHPSISFVSQRLSPMRNGPLVLAGELTMRGVTRKIELELRQTGRGKDPWGNERIGFLASGRIDRRDFGLTWNQALEAGGILVGHEVQIAIEVQAVREVE
jgi:polyisoprenoid-binding protein YceI